MEQHCQYKNLFSFLLTLSSKSAHFPSRANTLKNMLLLLEQIFQRSHQDLEPSRPVAYTFYAKNVDLDYRHNMRGVVVVVCCRCVARILLTISAHPLQREKIHRTSDLLDQALPISNLHHETRQSHHLENCA